MKHIALLFLVSSTFQQISYPSGLDAGSDAACKCGASGRVIAPPYLLDDGLDVELVGQSTGTHQKVHLLGTTFEFKPVMPGRYQFRVLNRAGRRILQSAKKLKGEGDYLILRFRLSSWEDSSANTVSVHQLSHRVPAKAMKAEREGASAAENGEVTKSIQFLENALALDPGFAEAQLQLGAAYYTIGQTQLGVQHAQAAYDLDPDSLDSGQELAMMFIMTKRYRDAEGVVRCLLGTHRQLPELQALLAASGIGGGGNIDEAFQHLKLAANAFPVARLLAANALAETGHYSLAVAQVRTFIASSNSTCERQHFEKWISHTIAQHQP